MNITVTKIATATKELVVTHPFEQITVTSIMHQAHLRRQTFYDFFLDKYDVLAWIYQTEAGNAATKCHTFKYWSQTVDQILHYFDDNRAFYGKILVLDVQNSPEETIKSHFNAMIENILIDLSTANNLKVDNEYRKFLQQILSIAIYGYVTDWMTAKNPRPFSMQRNFLISYIDDCIQGMLSHQDQVDTSPTSVRYISEL